MDIVRQETPSSRKSELKTHFIDVTVVHPRATSGGIEPGKAAQIAEKGKHALYDKKWTFDADQTLVPFAIETGGGWGEEGIQFLKYVAQQARTHSEYELPLCYSHFYRRLTERVAVATQRGVTRQIIHYLRYQSLKQFNDDVKPSGDQTGFKDGQQAIPSAME